MDEPAMDKPPTLEQMLRMMACHAAVVRGAGSGPEWRFYQAAEEYYELWRPFVVASQYPTEPDNE